MGKPFIHDHLHRGVSQPLFLVVVPLILSACHPGNKQAKQLRESCEAGDLSACNRLAMKLQKGEYVLQDPKDAIRAVSLLKQGCEGKAMEGVRRARNPIQARQGSAEGHRARSITLHRSMPGQKPARLRKPWIPLR